MNAGARMYLGACLVLAVGACGKARAAEEDLPAPTVSTAPGADFKQKLGESIRKNDQSVKVLRQQITESQNAPFLADLYVQLGDLLSQKALTLYYVQMERDGKTDTASRPVQESEPVVQATKEAIEIYRTVLQDFPKYAKRSEVEYKVTLCLKSIDEGPRFIASAGQLIKEYPDTQDAMRATVLLGRHFLDNHEFDEAYRLLKPISAGPYPYERALARHWIGLIDLGREKYVEALKDFEAVVLDASIKEQENPYDLGHERGHARTDLRREALIDSIRAYTVVHDRDPDPVGYYAKLCPTESYFQEVMEKLALRYVYLRKYDESVRLLRVVSERAADPGKVINVYREVLRSIPLGERASVPAREMQYVLEKLNVWRNYYQVPMRTLQEAYWFFEKQIRDLGTRNHDLAKTEKDPLKKHAELEQARDYYRLYLAYFDRTANSVKMATDLADVYFLLENYYRSGETYLRIFQGEFGKTPDRQAVIENAVLALQKDRSETFYDKVRAKGLLLKAVTGYQALSPALRRDPKLELLRLKTEYEQGFLPETLGKLMAFAGTARTRSQGVDAAELVLDYYNTRNDFDGLGRAADQLLGLHFTDGAFNAKLARVKLQAKAKIVQEKVKSAVGYDSFSESKSYLAAAMQSGDAATKDAALQEALARSRREHDIQTFLQAAALLAKKEKDPAKRAVIFRSIAQENMKIGRYYAALDQLRRAAGDPGLGQKDRLSFLEDALNASVAMHDVSAVAALSTDSALARTPTEVRARAASQLADALDSSAQVSPAESNAVFRLAGQNLPPETWVALYKSAARLSPAANAQVNGQLSSACTPESRAPLCLWSRLRGLEASRTSELASLQKAPTHLQGVEGVASYFMGVARKYQELEGSADAHLETILAVRGQELYAAFASYLGRVADANPDFRNDIVTKAKESSGTAEVYRQKCQTITDKAVFNPAMRYCARPNASLGELTAWHPARTTLGAGGDPGASGTLGNLQASAFSATSDADPALRLGAELIRQKFYHPAAALAGNGVNLYPDRAAEFRTLLGCSLLGLGFIGEASFHLRSGAEHEGMLSQCNQELTSLKAVSK